MYACSSTLLFLTYHWLQLTKNLTNLSAHDVNQPCKI